MSVIFAKKKNIRHFFFFLRNDNYHQNIANNNSPTFFFHLFLYYCFWNHTQYVGSGFVVNLAVNGAGEGLIQILIHQLSSSNWPLLEPAKD